MKRTKEFYIEKSKKIHGDKYDYSKVEYKHLKEKITIICQEHGEFLQTPEKHLLGQGCNFCNQKHLEREIYSMLTENNVIFEINNRKVLNGLELDFFIPSKNIAIECQGEQHFKSVSFFGGEDAFKNQIIRDDTKRELCSKLGIKLLYYSNLGINYPYKVHENKEEMLKYILE